MIEQKIFYEGNSYKTWKELCLKLIETQTKKKCKSYRIKYDNYGDEQQEDEDYDYCENCDNDNCDDCENQ